MSIYQQIHGVCVKGYIFLSPKGYVVSCRFHGALIVFLSVCKFVMSSVVHYGGGGMKV